MVPVFFITMHIFSSVYAGKLTVTAGNHEVKKENKYKKAYFAGGCFWCMEESFDQVGGVISVVSGYSGGHIKNPTYADVVYTDSGSHLIFNPRIARVATGERASATAGPEGRQTAHIPLTAERQRVAECSSSQIDFEHPAGSSASRD